MLLEDETYSDWALRPRQNLELARQEARLALARDRSAGIGQLGQEAVISAWENYAAHDPASEEAGAALMSAHAVLGERHVAARAYHRCREGLKELGLEPSASLEQAYQAMGHGAGALASNRLTDFAELTSKPSPLGYLSTDFDERQGLDRLAASHLQPGAPPLAGWGGHTAQFGPRLLTWGVVSRGWLGGEDSNPQ